MLKFSVLFPLCSCHNTYYACIMLKRIAHVIRNLHLLWVQVKINISVVLSDFYRIYTYVLD